MNCDIYTIGHSTHPVGEFIRMLKAYAIETLVDIRTIPRSKHNPQFNSDALAESLREHHIGYIHRKDLGGLRHAKKDSVNTGWRDSSFRGYADYMQTGEFAAALESLIVLSKRERLALCCAESLPWRCHRSLVADALSVRGMQVCNIMSETKAFPHRLTPFAEVHGTALTYPPEQGVLI